MSATYLPPIISSVYLEQLEAQAEEAKDAALNALNQAKAARDTALQYRNDAENYYTQVQQIQEGDYVTNLSLAETLAGFNFADLANIPARFEPAAHNHAWSEVVNKPTAYPPVAHSHEWGEITGKPTEFEPADHIHTWQQIAQKPGTFPPETHFHTWGEIENKPKVFNPAEHSHSWGDISGKPTKFEPADHLHTWDLIENKPLTFPPQSHHHHWSQVTNKPEQATRWPHFSEVTNKPEQATRWPVWDEVSQKPAFNVGAFSNVQAEVFGLGTVCVEGFEDFNNVSGCSFIAGNDNILNAPPWMDSRVMGGIHVDKGGRALQMMPNRFGDFGYRVKFDDVWADWVGFLTDKNTNFELFGASGQDVVAFGEMVTASVARFYMPINSYAAPTSIGVTGTFRILQGGSTIAAGVTPTFSALSSFKVLVVEVAGVSGNAGSPVNLRADSSSSKITGNF